MPGPCDHFDAEIDAAIVALEQAQVDLASAVGSEKPARAAIVRKLQLVVDRLLAEQASCFHANPWPLTTPVPKPLLFGCSRESIGQDSPLISGGVRASRGVSFLDPAVNFGKTSAGLFCHERGADQFVLLHRPVTFPYGVHGFLDNELWLSEVGVLEFKIVWDNRVETSVFELPIIAVPTQPVQVTAVSPMVLRLPERVFTVVADNLGNESTTTVQVSGRDAYVQQVDPKAGTVQAVLPMELLFPTQVCQVKISVSSTRSSSTGVLVIE